MEQAESLIRLYWYVRQINLQDIAGEPRGRDCKATHLHHHASFQNKLQDLSVIPELFNTPCADDFAKGLHCCAESRNSFTQLGIYLIHCRLVSVVHQAPCGNGAAQHGLQQSLVKLGIANAHDDTRACVCGSPWLLAVSEECGKKIFPVVDADSEMYKIKNRSRFQTQGGQALFLSITCYSA
jgi:hypothetical protein